MFTPKYKLLWIVLVSILISGCTSRMQTASNTPAASTGSQQPLSPRGLHYYVEQLARQLLSTANNIELNKTVAVGTILPSDLKNGNVLPHMAEFGLQVQDSLVTLSTQAGLKVVEFKATQTIGIGDNYDAMLSRELSALNNQIQADYFLTGTYLALEDKIMVNLRLIATPSNTIVAAATDYIPANTMWGKTKIALKANQIYRGSY